MTAPLGLATVVQKKNLVPVAKKEDFKMRFEKQNAKVCHNVLLLLFMKGDLIWCETHLSIFFIISVETQQSALQDCIQLKLVPSPAVPALDAHKGDTPRPRV